MPEPRFTQDSTEGYSGADLKVLNDLYAHACAQRGLPLTSDDLWIGSELDHIAETVLADFDAAHM